MCGIAGWLAAGREHRTRALSGVPSMLAALAHRGPDYTGHYEDGPLVLGHQRLAVLDPSPVAHQPMRTADGRFAIAYNGEVYNHRALRDELAARGHGFKSSGDTEVILAAFAEWGLTALDRLDGMFALALWDARARRLWLARDRAGIKPLYFTRVPEGLLFASELKALWSALPERARPEPAALLELALLGHLAGERTPFTGVFALRAGEILGFAEGGETVAQGWLRRPADEVSPEAYRALDALPEAEHVAHLEGLLRASVEAQLVSDAKLGVLCSGGLDSSLLTALAHELQPGISIFHAAHDGPGSEEGWAREVGRHTGCALSFARMTRERYLAEWPRAVWHADLPLYHPSDLSLQAVCDLARAEGCKVLLSGEGADELFGGYAWHAQRLRVEQRRAGALRDGMRGLLARLAQRLATAAPEPTLGGAAGEGLFGLVEPQSGLEAFARAAQGALSGGARWRIWRDALERYAFVAELPERRTLAQMLADLRIHLDTLLCRNDRMGMSASIENRVPYLADALVAYGVNLPLRFRIRGGRGKWLLRRVALRHLPERVVERRKAGFPLPWRGYLPTSPRFWEGGFVAEWLDLPPGAIEAWIGADAGLRFRLQNLEIWGRLFSRGEAVADVGTWLAGHA